MNPKVFVSHASEDKNRFVRQFAIRLRDSGIDAWLDEWEMRPGDSLIDKIFNEGLKDAQAMIIVLSNASVAKPWVREELNAGMVKKIQQKCKIIPVVIDDCEVPECLKSTVYQRIDDLADYDGELSRILEAIFDYSSKPPLGPLPPFTAMEVPANDDLARTGWLVLKLIGEAAIEADSALLAAAEFEAYAVHSLGLTMEQFNEALSDLEGGSYVETVSNVNDEILALKITHYGLSEYIRAYVPGYSALLRQAGLRLVNHGETASDEVSESLGQPHMLVRHAFMEFKARGWIKYPDDGDYHIVGGVRPGLKRWLNRTVDNGAQAPLTASMDQGQAALHDPNRPYIGVEKLEWVPGEEGKWGKLRLTLKNHGSRPASNVYAVILMIDATYKFLPAPDFNFGTANDIPCGTEFVQEQEWSGNPSFTCIRVQVAVSADDPLVGGVCPQRAFYYIWGEPDVFTPNQPFRSMSQQEKREFEEYLDSREDIPEPDANSVKILPGVPQI